jgi:2-oxoglutarate dehydrogenase E2 component (dihydrolipoamide succinyltransferase)
LEAGGTSAEAAPKKAAKAKKDEPKAVAPEAAPAVEATPEPVAAAPEPAPAPVAAAPKVADDSRITRKKLSPLRRKIATQLVAAQHNAAILTTFNECDMSAVIQLRKDMQEDFQKKHGIKLGFMSFFIKAAVDALKAIPSINSRLDGDEQITNHYYDIGVAVGTEKGLIVPVVRDCDTKSFADIERDLAAYAVKAREGKIGLEDLQGGVFTVSNGGVYGSLMSTPILNPPQSGILGMHKTQERPVAVNGQVVIRPMMYLALSYDHRVVDGKEAVTFLVRVKECIENPMRLLLGT